MIATTAVRRLHTFGAEGMRYISVVHHDVGLTEECGSVLDHKRIQLRASGSVIGTDTLDFHVWGYIGIQ